MDYGELIPSIAMTVVFVAVLPFGQKVWLIADTSITSVWGLASLLCPQVIMKYQIDGDLNSVHIYMYRMFGALLLSTSLFSLITWKSQDSTVKISVLWARVVAISVYILNRIYSLYNYKKGPAWNERGWYFGIYGDVLWFLGNFYHTLRSSDWGTSPESYTRLDLHLRIDFLQTFFLALMLYVFPGHIYGFQVTQKLGQLHLSLIRVAAAFLFGSAVLSLSATRFRNTDDKLAHIISRILTNTCMITIQLYSQYAFGDWNVGHIYFSIVGMSVWTVNSGIAYMHHVKKTLKTD